MNLTLVRDLLKEVVEAGRMTPVAKDKLNEAYNMVNDRVEQDKQRDRLKKEQGVQLGFAKTSSIIRDMTSALNVFCRYPKEHNSAVDDVKVLERARQDIWHKAEFSKQLGLTNEDKIDAWNRMEGIAEERRVAKKFIEASTPIKILLAKYPKIKDELKTAMAQIREIENVQESRCYTPKELTDMTEAFHKVAPVKEKGKIVIKEGK